MQSGHLLAQNLQWSSRMKIVCSPTDEAIHKLRLHHPCERYKVPMQETLEHDTTKSLPEYERMCKLYHLCERYEDPVQKTSESETEKASAEFERMHIAQEFTGQRIYNGNVPKVQWSSRMTIGCSPKDDEFHEPEKPEAQFLLPVQDTLKHKTGKELTESIVTGRAKARLLELMFLHRIDGPEMEH